MLDGLRTWWRRPSGGAEVLAVMLPLVISTSSWTVMQFTDRVFLVWHSKDALAAALPAGVLSFAVACFPLGLVSYVNTFVAQYYGAGRPQRIGVAVWQAVFLTLAISPLLLATHWLAPAIFEASNHGPEILELEIVYYQAMNFGTPALILSAAFSSFFTGRGKTRVVMVVDMAAALFNVVLDYAWIFGIWGLPAWGIAGAAWATVVSLWAKTLVYFVLFLLPEARRVYGTWSGCRWDGALTRRLLSFAMPSGVQMLIEISGFTVLLFLLGQLGPLELAATSLAFNVNSLAFMPVYGAGIATATLVGQRLGDNQPKLAAQATWTAFVIAAAYMAVFSAIYFLLPEQLLWLHEQSSRGQEDFTELRDMTVVLLRFVAAYSMFDAMCVVFAGALKGAGDTRFIMWTASVISSIAVAVTWIGLEFFGFGILACWATITAWICALGVIYWLRFNGGKWQTMRVIEPELDEDTAENTVSNPSQPVDVVAETF
jgi:MATE family multidrug resistance protein